MNPHHPHSKLEHLAQAQTTAQQQTHEQQQTIEFATAEEMIRHDAAQVPVPPAVTERLRKSVAAEPRPQRPWWQRWLGQPG